LPASAIALVVVVVANPLLVVAAAAVQGVTAGVGVPLYPEPPPCGKAAKGQDNCWIALLTPEVP